MAAIFGRGMTTGFQVSLNNEYRQFASEICEADHAELADAAGWARSSNACLGASSSSAGVTPAAWLVTTHTPT